ncbi:DUF3303 domain-containing protein [Photobacterium aphoticum]|uniref:DUF3303 domain-containing protein n=2 Tax=Photobacterium aphoticum TaxID=754436 RepID=A0A0J1GS87_9GAMM|nr:DUF3303 family protein [Photobacterium aphoticum]KLV02521.1 hypothetical protein ABT58_02995 [Photobacterium aphoticum]PSU56967.1 DUF3303 domain-containing protein [Photobacterium aphoticum]
MTFLISWQIYQGRTHDVLAHFAQLTKEQDDALMGDDITLIGRWHDVVSGAGVCVVESNSIEAVTAYALRWNNDMDISVQPVIDDEAARQLGSALVI